MPHVGIQGFRTRGGKEDAAEDHEPLFVGRAEQHFYCIKRIKGAQHGEIPTDIEQSVPGQEEKPEQHDRPEKPADGAGAGALNDEQHKNDRKRDDKNLVLTVSEKTVHQRDAAEAFNRGGDGNGRGEYTVSEKGRAADHGGENQPGAAFLYQRIESKYAAFPMVVGLHGNDDIFHSGEQGNRPDDKGEGADDEL